MEGSLGLIIELVSILIAGGLQVGFGLVAELDPGMEGGEEM